MVVVIVVVVVVVVVAVMVVVMVVWLVVTQRTDLPGQERMRGIAEVPVLAMRLIGLG